jgi:hypothetical protein
MKIKSITSLSWTDANKISAFCFLPSKTNNNWIEVLYRYLILSTKGKIGSTICHLKLNSAADEEIKIWVINKF